MDGLRKACILGTGSYIPERVVTNNDLSRILDTSDEWIRTRTGIRERHLAAENESASDMAVKAAERALKMSGIPKHRIGFIILATGTPDYPIPNTSSLVQDKLGLPHAGAVDISAGCAGFIHGLVMAKGLVSSGVANGSMNVAVRGPDATPPESNATERMLSSDKNAAAKTMA